MTFSDWVPVIPSMLAFVLVLFGPGLAVLATVMRVNLVTVAVAPAITLGLVGVGGVLLERAGVPWSLLSWGGFTALVALVAWLVRRLVRAPREGGSTDGRQWAWAATGSVVAAVLVGSHVLRMVVVPGAISQTWDVQFHLNAVRHILVSGEASSLGLYEVFGSRFYPLGFHSVAAAVEQVTGTGIPDTVNALSVVVAAVVWPLGCIALAHVLVPRRPWVSLIAGILAGAFGMFPYQLLVVGVVLAQFLTTALVPAVLALGIACLRVDVAGSPRRGGGGGVRERIGLPVVRVLTMLVACAGLVFAQPTGMLVATALLAPVILAATGRHIRALVRAGGRAAVPAVVTTALVGLGAVVLIAAIWRLARPPAVGRRWPPVMTLHEAVRTGLTLSPSGDDIELVVVALMAVGVLAVVLRPRRWWVVASAAVPVLLYVAAAGMPMEWRLRVFLTDPFFSDWYRLAALLPITAIMLAPVGAGLLADAGGALAGVVAGRSARSGAGVAAALRAVGVVGLLAGVFVTLGLRTPGVDTVVAEGHRVYNESSRFLSAPERALIEELPALTPEGSLIAVNPAMGGSFTWALADRAVTAPYFDTPTTPDLAFVNAHLNEIEERPEVCSAVRAIGLGYVLDFGQDAGTSFDAALWAGFEGLAPGPHLELVAETAPEARLFRIVC